MSSAGDRMYKDAVKREFVDKVIEKIKDLKKDCDVTTSWDIRKEVGGAVIELLYETFGNVLKDSDVDDDEED